MTRLEKLYQQALRTPGSVRFSDLDRLLQRYGFKVSQAGSGTSHFNYRRGGVRLTVPKHGHDAVKAVYVREVLAALEQSRSWRRRKRRDMRMKVQTPKTLAEYLTLPYTVRITPDPSGGFVAAIEELPGCITQGETWEETGAMARDAMTAWISGAIEDEEEVPIPDMETTPARFVLRLPRMLYQTLSRAAKREGVSLNQYMLSVLASAAGTSQVRSASATRAGIPEREAHAIRGVAQVPKG